MKIQLLFFCATTLLVLNGAQAQDPILRSGEFRFGSLPSLQNYSLDGTGFTASNGLSFGNGTSFGFTAMRERSALKFDYSDTSYQISSPTGLTPTEINSNFKRWVLNYEFMRSDIETERSFKSPLEKGVTYSVGIDSRTRSAGITTPNTFMPTTLEMGVRLGMTYNRSLDEIFMFTAGGGFFFPLYMEEAGEKTGYYRFSLSPDLFAQLVYKVNHFIDFAAGLQLLYTHMSYAGSGTRGVSNATEATANIYAPIELRFKF